MWVRVSIAASGRAGAMDPGIHRSCGSPPGARRQHPGTAGGTPGIPQRGDVARASPNPAAPARHARPAEPARYRR
ncbi:MAG TPA: hypothetical protein VN695_07460, partial [Streptosporangiaceae bacterium]|nr:hypothetical protein [Streptosporangiaceae bacterium]